MDFNFQEPHTPASVVGARTMIVDKFDGALFRYPQTLGDFERFFIGVSSALHATPDTKIYAQPTEYDVKVQRTV